MKNLQKVLMILCVMGLMISCGGSGGGNTPEKVAEKFVEAFFKGDLDGMKKCSSKETKEELSGKMDEKTKNFFEAMKAENKGASVKAIETKLSEDGNSGTVKVEVSKDGSANVMKVKVIKEDGKWAVSGMDLK
ncbi:MAG: DUF4878 domain-containing protein [Dysgonamonadaceae bacterium]|jgi:Na+-translocating ferredoxin:NAD+ oxidoreductase RnfG subunit|nr:DUF4878 domain-containing protein [Dysgonamonadaceae bacterium]